MPTSIAIIFIVFSILVILSIYTIKLSNRFGIPSLVLFLAIGMLAGSDGLGGITFDNPLLVRSLGITALVLILFSGGLDTEWSAIRPIMWQGVSLSTIGVLWDHWLDRFPPRRGAGAEAVNADAIDAR